MTERSPMFEGMERIGWGRLPVKWLDHEGNEWLARFQWRYLDPGGLTPIGIMITSVDPRRLKVTALRSIRFREVLQEATPLADDPVAVWSRVLSAKVVSELWGHAAHLEEQYGQNSYEPRGLKWSDLVEAAGIAAAAKGTGRTPATVLAIGLGISRGGADKRLKRAGEFGFIEIAEQGLEILLPWLDPNDGGDEETDIHAPGAGWRLKPADESGLNEMTERDLEKSVPSFEPRKEGEEE